MNSAKHFNLKNARIPAQFKQMQDLTKKGICPFCREHFETNHREPILREKKWWIVTKNDYPYDGTKIHFLLVYKKHIDSVEKVSKDGAIELLEHLQWLKKKYKIPGASLVMRFGDHAYTGATITHLHCHVVHGYKQKKNSESIKSSVGYKK